MALDGGGNEVVDLTEDDRGADDCDASDDLAGIDRELEEVESELEALLQRQSWLQERRRKVLAGLELEARAPRADWSGEFEWSPRLRSVLASTFSLSDFRPLQEEVINASMQGRDVLCLMPSGGGKSLCYQIPALVEQKVTLVVSPLLSLIQDQVQGLRSLGVRAEGLSSMSAKEEQQAVFKSMDSPDSGLLLLYVTPERVASSKRFLGKLDKLYHAGRLGRIAVDEAHCCSQWGNDFRPDYKKLGVLKQQFPQTPIIALTATATERVCADLREILGIENSELFRKSINRPNLFYEVAHKPGSADAQVALILDWIHHHYGAGDSGIVYCLTQKDTEAMATKLQAAGLSAGCYHANMDPAERQWVHSQWSVGALQIITATIAFGMGINKPDVRFVIHETLSKSLENYYQESGRAGRDGRPARCLLLHRFSDIPRQASLVCLEPRWEHNLRQAMLYAGSRATCRRATLAMHFGEAPSDCGGMCDVCAARYPFSCVAERDITAQGQAVLRTLAAQQQVQKKCTLLQLWERWRTSKAGDDAKLAKGMTREEAEEVVAQLMYKSFLDFEFGYTAYATTAYLCCSAKSMLLLNGRGTLTAPAQLPSLLEREKEVAATLADCQLYSSLDAMRQRAAEERCCLPESVLSADAMERLCLERPATLEALGLLLGRAKAATYGKHMLKEISQAPEPEAARAPRAQTPERGRTPIRARKGRGEGGASAAAPKRKRKASVIIDSPPSSEGSD